MFLLLALLMILLTHLMPIAIMMIGAAVALGLYTARDTSPRHQPATPARTPARSAHPGRDSAVAEQR